MKRLYLLFLLALFLDLVVLPTTGALVWLPRFSLALMPFIFLFAKERILWPIFVILALVFWLTTGLNLGIVTLALGLTLFFERWLLPKSFHKDTWQILVISSLGVLDFGLAIWFFTLILTQEKDFLSAPVAMSFVLTTILAAAFNFILWRYEKTVV